MTTVETIPALRTRLLVDLSEKRSYLQLAGEGLGYNERYTLVHTIRKQLGLTAQELDGVFSLGNTNMLTLESNDGLTYETWQQVAAAIGEMLNTHVSVITKDDCVAFAQVQPLAVVGEMLNAVTSTLVERAVQTTTPNQW